MPRVRRPLLALIVLVLAVAIGYGIDAIRHDHGGSSSPPQTPTSSASALSALPVQARQTIALIEKGGPFPYPRNDGVVFHNDEHLLPKQPDGYYHEYTVPTPGSPDRGARRIIAGGHGEFYYTADHYEHFVRVETNQ